MRLVFASVRNRSPGSQKGVAALDVADGVAVDAGRLTLETIREHVGYRGIRLRMLATLGSARGELAWDVSSGDPIVPPPRLIELQRVLGDPIPIWSYAPETAIAEKVVTLLERGITSTRWRDYVDIVQLHRGQRTDPAALREALEAVAHYRNVELRAVETVGRRLRGSVPGEVGSVAPQERCAGSVRSASR